MGQHIALVTLIVSDYDDAIAFYVGRLGFQLLEDTRRDDDKRWAIVAPSGQPGPGLLLAKAANGSQKAAVGAQGGGRVFLFLYTDDFSRDHAAYKAQGVHFTEAPRVEPYGTVAVFEDLYGNHWDLLQPAAT